MATVAIYIFTSNDLAQKATYKLDEEISSGGFAKIDLEVRIDSSCEDIELAGDICQAHGGNLK